MKTSTSPFPKVPPSQRMDPPVLSAEGCVLGIITGDKQNAANDYPAAVCDFKIGQWFGSCMFW